MHQKLKATDTDTPALGRTLDLEDRILRLQYLVSHLIEKNEELRQKVAAGFREEPTLSPIPIGTMSTI